MTQSKIINHSILLDKVAPGGRIGLIALATDFNSEQELRRFLPDDVEIFTNRVLNANPLTVENLRNMASDISRAAGGILPGLKLDAMIYGCTSGTVANGAQKIEQLIQNSCPNILVTNPLTAVFEALKSLNIKRISILTPYIEEVNLAMLNSFQEQGLEVINIHGLNFDDDIDITGIPVQDIVKYALETIDESAEALFISCTSLRTSSVITHIEKLIQKPVITSNQALAWHSLQLINHPHSSKELGQLLENKS